MNKTEKYFFNSYTELENFKYNRENCNKAFREIELDEGGYELELIAENKEDIDKYEICKSINSYGFNYITALNIKYDFISVIAKEIIFNYVEKNLKNEKIEVEPALEELESFLVLVKKYADLDNKGEA